MMNEIARLARHPSQSRKTRERGFATLWRILAPQSHVNANWTGDGQLPGRACAKVFDWGAAARKGVAQRAQGEGLQWDPRRVASPIQSSQEKKV